MPLPLILVAIAVLAAGGTIVIVSSKRSKVEGTSMVVLGESFSGKTSFLYRLGLVKKDGGSDIGDRTAMEDYIEPAVIKGKNEIKIKPGFDFGGTQNLQRKGIRTSDDCDIVIYFFDGYRFFKEEYYRDKIQRMLEYLYDKFSKNGRPLKNAVIIASNADTYENKTKKDRKELFEIIKQNFTGPEQALLEENFYIINATEKAEVLNVADSLFEKGVFNNK